MMDLRAAIAAIVLVFRPMGSRVAPTVRVECDAEGEPHPAWGDGGQVWCVWSQGGKCGAGGACGWAVWRVCRDSSGPHCATSTGRPAAVAIPLGFIALVRSWRTEHRRPSCRLQVQGQQMCLRGNTT